LAEEFRCRYLDRCDVGPTGISPEACTVLMQHEWPGNIRQLRNVVEAAAALAGPDPTIGMLHVVEVLSSAALDLPSIDILPTLAEARRRAEEHAILDALRRTEGNRERAAKLLRISEATLYRKLGRRPAPDALLTQAS
jgi:DNA-binding NtrC family response regulator